MFKRMTATMLLLSAAIIGPSCGGYSTPPPGPTPTPPRACNHTGVTNAGGTMGPDWGGVVQALHTNLSRVGIDTRWWDGNAEVPKQGKRYQDWIAHIVHTLEADGLYVELDATTNFWENPCSDPGGSDCPSQDQGENDYRAAFQSGNQQQIAHYYQGLAVYTPISVTALTSLAQTFGSDPAVIFDVWNEPAD